MNDYLNVLLWSLGIGVCLCNFYIYYNKVILGALVRRLLEKGADAPEKALSLAETGLDGNAFVKNALKRKSSSVYGVVAEGNTESAYYIPEEKREKAEKMFSTKESSLAVAIASSILILIMTFLVTLVVPFIVSMIQGIF